MPTDDFFRARIDQMIDLSHPLAVLARRMPWESLEKALAPTFAHRDRKGRSVRLLVAEMEKEGMNYPLHLGVTEAGEGEDGRIKSAVGIGALLNDGIGDTIRVSLS